MTKFLSLFALLALTVQAATNDIPITLGWEHESIGRPDVITFQDPHGVTSYATNLPITFTIYRTYSLTNVPIIWVPVGQVVNTNVFKFTNSYFKTAFWTVTASNGFGYETPFSNVAVAENSAPATAVKIRRDQ